MAQSIPLTINSPLKIVASIFLYQQHNATANEQLRKLCVNSNKCHINLLDAMSKTHPMKMQFQCQIRNYFHRGAQSAV